MKIGWDKKVTVKGDLQVDGTTTTVNSTTVTIDDPIFTLGGDGAGLDDAKDRGIEFKWNSGGAKVGFFGMDDGDNTFMYIPDAYRGEINNVYELPDLVRLDWEKHLFSIFKNLFQKW